MPSRVFVDANVLVYAQDTATPDKLRRSREIITRLSESGDGVISTQVLQEFFVAVTCKLGVLPLVAKGVMKTFSIFEIVPVSTALIYEAIDCAILNQLSFWDALILAAAASAGCTTVLSEDLNPSQAILGVRIQNPFL